MKRKYIALLVVGLLIVDQVVKVLVKTNMTLGESIHVFGDWFQIFFIENEGAAFGLKLGGEWGKLALSLFRIGAVGAIGWYVNRLWKQGAPKGVLIGMSMILAGAMGNIIDSAFYGIVFAESTYTSVATFLPDGGGYAGFLHGKVVDMLYFPLFTIGKFVFFAPVFNIADSYITVAVFYLLIFQRKYFKKI